MKPVLFLVLALAAVAQSTPDASGWSAATWGMTAQQVREAFPAAQSVDPPQRDLGALIHLQASPVQLGPYQARAEFEFQPDQDRLTAVSVTVSPDAPRPSAFDTLKQSLVAKYGAPASSDSTTDRAAPRITTRTVLWRLNSSTITLEWFEARDVGSVRVRYAERKPDPTL